MSESIVIKGANQPTQATFLPENGLRLVSYKMGEKDLIDEGIIIGPTLSSHLLQGSWSVETRGDAFDAKMDTMRCRGAITPEGLELHLSIVAESDALIGFDCRFPLSGEKKVLTADVQPQYFSEGREKQIPPDWNYSEQGKLTLDLNQSYSCGFRPLIDPLCGKIRLETDLHSYSVTYNCCCEENSWTLNTPGDGSLVSITPVSAQNPWYPNLTVSSLRILLGT